MKSWREGMIFLVEKKSTVATFLTQKKYFCHKKKAICDKNALHLKHFKRLCLSGVGRGAPPTLYSPQNQCLPMPAQPQLLFMYHHCALFFLKQPCSTTEVAAVQRGLSGNERWWLPEATEIPRYSRMLREERRQAQLMFGH